MNRLWELLQIVLSIFVDRAEDAIPLERRLAYDRTRRSGSLKNMMGSATDVGEIAEQMVQSLAEARIIQGNLRDEIAGHLKAAKAAAGRGDLVTEAREKDMAAALADDVAEAEAEVAELEAMANDSLSDKQEALQMVLDQAQELERLAQKDARLVSRVRMSGMRQQSLDLKEQMLDLIPEDTSTIRQRATEQAKRTENRVKARGDVVNALWQQRRKGTTVNRASQMTSRGSEILAQISAEVGYTPATADQTVVVEEETQQASRRAKANK